MKQDILKQYTKLRTSLEQERVRLQKQLQQIEAALGTEAVQGADNLVPFPEVEAAPIRRGPGRPKGGKRKMSAAGKARIIAATKARWAKLRAEKAGKSVALPQIATPTAKPKKVFSKAARAALSAAAKARWAKAKAAGKGKL
jgi:hypothetical protein